MSIALVQELTADLLVGSDSLTRDLAGHVTSWGLDMGVDRTTQLDITLDDSGLTVWRSGPFQRGTAVRWRDLDLVIASDGIGPGPAQEQVTFSARVAGVQTLRQETGPTVWSNVAPHELVQSEAARVGLGFFGETTTARRAQIARAAPTGASSAASEMLATLRRTLGKVVDEFSDESTWDVFTRLADEVGFLLFESEGVVVFARPSWLVERAGTLEHVHVWRWPTTKPLQSGEHPLQDVPDCQHSDDLETTTISGTILTSDAIGYRPGHAVHFSGIGGFEGLYLVTGVEIVPGDALATVEVATPIDPEPNPVAGSETKSAVFGAPVSGGPVVGPPVGGSYGFQYDPVGSMCRQNQPGSVALMAVLVQRFPGSRGGPQDIYNCRQNTADASELSMHAEGRAGDIFVPVLGGSVGDAIALWLVANAEALGIQSVIWNRRSWNSRRRTWVAYTGPNPHIDHVHWELCWQAATYLTTAQLAAA